MTIDDEIQLQPATSGDGAIVPEGRYTLHLIGLEKAPPSTFKPEDGPRVKWIFNLYAEMVDGLEKGQQFKFNGEPYEFWRTTSTKNSKRAYARQYFEALAGRQLEDKEVPRLSSVIGAKMSAMISYDDDPDDPNNKLLKMSGLRHIEAAKPTAAAGPAAKPAPAADADDDEDPDRALLIRKINRSLKTLKGLDAAAAKRAQAAVDESDLDEALMEDLEQLSAQISAAVMAARDAED